MGRGWWAASHRLGDSSICGATAGLAPASLPPPALRTLPVVSVAVLRLHHDRDLPFAEGALAGVLDVG